MLPPAEPNLLWLELSPGIPTTTGPWFLRRESSRLPAKRADVRLSEPKAQARLRMCGTSGRQYPNVATDRELWRRRKQPCCASFRSFCPRTGRKPCMKASFRLRYSPGWCSFVRRAFLRRRSPGGGSLWPEGLGESDLRFVRRVAREGSSESRSLRIVGCCWKSVPRRRLHSWAGVIAYRRRQEVRARRESGALGAGGKPAAGHAPSSPPLSARLLS